MIFKWLLIRDFVHWSPGIGPHELSRMAASLESCYNGGQWDLGALSESIQNGLMFGLDMQIFDAQGKEIMSSHGVIESLSGLVKNQITHSLDLNPLNGKYDRQPLFSENRGIGTFKFRFFRRRKEGEGEAGEKMDAFFRTSLWIASVGALILSLLFSGYIPD